MERPMLQDRDFEAGDVIEDSAVPPGTQDVRNDAAMDESAQVSLSSVPTSSWDNGSINESAEGRKSKRGDRRKLIGTTTPTLVDEDFELEEEMVSLDQERMRRDSSQMRDEGLYRRTPGARMYASRFEGKTSQMRRTPGATDMHKSAARGDGQGMGEGAILGFGLTLSTPVGSAKRAEQNWESFSSSSASSSPLSKKDSELFKEDKPTKEQRKGQEQGEAISAMMPAWDIVSLSRGPCSPNTLRLTEDLGNLLDDGEEQNFSHREVFRGKSEAEMDSEAQESWTSSYIFVGENAHGQRVRQSKPSGRARRSSGRRSRNSNSPSMNVVRNGPLPYANARHPKPVRSTGRDSGFVSQGFQPAQDIVSGPGSVAESGQATPKQLHNLGGAFGPPSKHRSSNFHHPAMPVPNVPVVPRPPFQGYQDPVVAQQGMVGGPPQLYGHFAGPGVPQTQGGNFAFGPPVPHVGFGVPEAIQQRPHEIPHSFMPYAPPPPPPPQPYPMQQMFWPHPQYEPMAHPSAGWQGNSFSVVGRPLAGEKPPQYPGGAPTQSASPNVFAGGGLLQKPPETEHNVSQTGQQEPNNEISQATAQREEATMQRAKTPVPKLEKSESKNQTKRTGKGGKDATSKNFRKKQTSYPASPNKGNTKGARGRKREGLVATPEPVEEDGDEVKKTELVESPSTRASFKEFYREYRLKERSSFREAKEFALSALEDEGFPSNLHWRVYLELADLAKRSNQFEEARKLYVKVCELQPYASKGWLEYSKLEEECGHMRRCSRILKDGLSYCPLSENLLTRAIKHEEKTGNIDRARELLSRLKHVGIEKVWRAVLEGALLEARAGNHAMARRVLKYLMHHVPWYGPLYQEAYRLERDLGRPVAALAVVENGLTAIPRYGPLWFGAFRICEGMDLSEKAFEMPRTSAMLDRAKQKISRELIWKVHLDAAEIMERGALAMETESSDKEAYSNALVGCRRRLAMTALSCPRNLCWKVWLAGGRMELCAGNSDVARKLFLRAHQVVPEKGRSVTLLECARLEEYTGDTDLARALLLRGRFEMGSDWKVWLESVMLEVRAGQLVTAVDLARQSLDIHSGAGRLWASLVQLRYFLGEDAQYSTLKRALKAVPKSGEVWCEGGRIHLNPFSKLFDWEEARLHLGFATRFTPQYGDSFLETLRLNIIEHLILPMAFDLWEEHHESVEHCEDDLERTCLLVQKAFRIVQEEAIVEQLKRISLDNILPSGDLELRCANADPNYGLLWFRCRDRQTDTARVVLHRAKELLIEDIRQSAPIYVAAVVRRLAVVDTVRRRWQVADTDWEGDNDDLNREAHVAACASATPSIETLLLDGSAAERQEGTGTVLLEGSVTGASFVTGLVELNQRRPLHELSLVQKRKLLFGSDTPFS